MATATATTPIRATEVLHIYKLTPTPIMSAFAHLLDALARHAVAERDIEDVDIWDVGFRHWLTEAEEVFTEVTTLLSRIRRADIGRAEDLPLQRVADVIDAMIGSEEPGMFQRLHAWLPTRLFDCPGASPAARQVRRMLGQAGERIDGLAHLQTYAALPPAGEADRPGMSLAV